MDEFIGVIKLFAGNFPPKDWAFCNGQLLSIASNSALFSILGTTYGGDGITTFALPDLRGRVPVHNGDSQGPGLQYVDLGEAGGTNTNTLLTSNIPPHNHAIRANNQAGNSADPSNNYPANTGAVDKEYSDTANTTMNIQMTGLTGGGIPVNNMQPYLGLNYIICLYGIYPPRN
ncbi:Microcystin-dependent protein [Sinomicrobium oceani]|uniref:Microcystin-dependent protein n=1 Tax=Sinomicrobium oceani TaxID=1150368 RepID=A0A1K1RYU4_9FLAO|nr:tail fiber protein [Sinomicrobium oceani]SFW77299.1 Microcystin-dependent protein [Sinomicrobium oceani]